MRQRANEKRKRRGVDAKKGKNANEKERVSEKVCRYLGVTPDFLLSESMIEIRGRGYMMIHGSGKIISYTPEEIRIRLKKSCLSIRGTGLVCISYHVDSVGIEGRISDICFYGEDI